jgi:hypothetical protein
MPEEKRRPIYDDATLERMKRYFGQENQDELLKYIKTHGMRRHADIYDEGTMP